MRCGMHSLASVANERSFQVNAQRARPALRSLVSVRSKLDRICQSSERAQSRIQGSRHSGWVIARDSMPSEQSLDGGQGIGTIVHDIEASAAMNMQINIARCDHAVAQIEGLSPSGNRPRLLDGDFDDLPLGDEHQRMLDSRRWRHQLCRGESQHINVLIRTNCHLDKNCISLSGRADLTTRCRTKSVDGRPVGRPGL